MISIRLNGILGGTAVRLPQTSFKKLVVVPLLKYILRQSFKKSFLCAPFGAGKESEEVEISFLLQGTKKDSKLIIRRKFKLKNGEIVF